MNLDMRGRERSAGEVECLCALFVVDFEQEAAMRDHDARRVGEEAADEVEAVGAAVQREGRLVFGNGQTAKVIGGDVRKISKEEMVISNWRLEIEYG